MLDEKMLDNNILNNNTNNYGTNDNNTHKINAYKKLYNKINENYCAIGNKIFGSILFSEINKMLPNIAKFILIESIFTASFTLANASYMDVSKETKENLVEIKILEKFFFPITKDLLKATSILTTESIGSNNHNKVWEILKHSYIIGLITSIAFVIPSVLLTSKFLYNIETVSRYLNIWATSLPFVAIFEANIQSLIALKKYNIVLGFGLISAILLASLSVSLTPKFQEDGLPLSLLITHIIQAALIPTYIYLFKKKEFEKYFVKAAQDNSDNHQAGDVCEHCRMNAFNLKLKLLKKILFLGLPVALTKIMNHSYSLFFGKILEDLGPDAKLISSLIEQITPILYLPLGATSVVLTQELGEIYGKLQNTESIEDKIIHKDSVKLKIKAALTIQSVLYSIPFLLLMTQTAMISGFFEEISKSKKELSPENENCLESITKIICLLSLINSASGITESLCNSFQRTHITAGIEFIENALNFAASYYIFKQFENHGELIDYDYSFLATSSVAFFIGVYYAKCCLFNNMQNVEFNNNINNNLNLEMGPESRENSFSINDNSGHEINSEINLNINPGGVSTDKKRKNLNSIILGPQKKLKKKNQTISQDQNLNISRQKQEDLTYENL